MQVHWDVLTGEAGSVLELLARQPWIRGFYLAGGTGLALQLGHRISVDMDLFTATDPLSFETRLRMVSGLVGTIGHEHVLVDQETDGTLGVHIHGVGVSFFHYPYPLVAPLVPILAELQVASPEDIGLMKIAAIIGRGSKRDFLDLYFVTRNIPLERLLEMGSTKFPQVRDFGAQAVRALVYFEDAESQRMPKMLRRTTWKAVKEYFVREVRQLSRRWIESSRE